MMWFSCRDASWSPQSGMSSVVLQILQSVTVLRGSHTQDVGCLPLEIREEKRAFWEEEACLAGGDTFHSLPGTKQHK